jgi:ferric-dicitrate binding protein FerR (iron transport regulator)
MSNTWVNGEYKFVDKPLGFIIKRLENYYNANISLDDSLRNIRYTGTFSSGQSIEQVLPSLINVSSTIKDRHQPAGG